MERIRDLFMARFKNRYEKIVKRIIKVVEQWRTRVDFTALYIKSLCAQSLMPPRLSTNRAVNAICLSQFNLTSQLNTQLYLKIISSGLWQTIEADKWKIQGHV